MHTLCALHHRGFAVTFIRGDAAKVQLLINQASPATKQVLFKGKKTDLLDHAAAHGSLMTGGNIGVM